MTNFTLNPIQEIDGRQSIYKLLINNKCQFDEFESKIEKNGQYQNEISSIYSYIEDVANNKSLPNTKFKIISNKKATVKEYEFKTKHLRVYAIAAPNGKIIIMGSYKNSQEKDINKFRKIKDNYLKSIDK